MSVLAWMGLGLIAGLVASNILSHSGQGLLLDMVLGIVGAIVVLWAYHAFSGRSP